MAALLTGAAAIGMAGVFARLLMNRGLGPSAAAMWRLGLAAPLFWVQPLLGSAKRSDGESHPVRLGRLLWLSIPGVFFAVDLSFWHWSIRFTTVANATLLSNFAAIFVALVGRLCLRERLGGVFVVGLILALVGAAVVLRASFALSARYVLGDVLGLCSAVFYAGYQLWIKRLRGRFTVPEILGASAVSSVALLALISWLSAESMWPASRAVWGVVVLLAVVSQFCGQGLIAFAFAHLPAGLASVSLLFQPVVAAVAAWGIFGETLGPLQIAGGAVVLVGIALARISSLTRPRAILDSGGEGQ